MRTIVPYIEIIQNINFQTLTNFNRRKITKSIPNHLAYIQKVYIDNLFMNGSARGTGCQPQLSSCRSRRWANHIVHTPWQKSAGKLHFYGNVSWRYQVVRTRLTNADNLARWQPRTPFPTAVVRPSSRLPTSNWFGAFNFTKITGTWGRGTQVPLMVIIYGNGTGRSTAQTTREHGSLFSERGTRERGIFAGRCLIPSIFLHGPLTLGRMETSALCIFLFLFFVLDLGFSFIHLFI